MSPTGKGWLRIAIEDFFETTKVGKWLAAWWEDFAHGVERGILGEFPAVLDELDKIPELKKYLDLKGMLASGVSHQGGLLGAGGMAWGMGMSAASGMLAPIMRKINYVMDKWVQSARIDVAQFLSAYWRDLAYHDRIGHDIAELGWNDERLKILQEIARPRSAENILLLNMLRGKTTETAVQGELRKRGYLDDDIGFIFEQVKLIPNPQDLVRMAVREAWNEEVVEQFQYDAGLPPEFSEWMTKQGYSADWAKRFWRAHWELPGVSQAYEMVHRLRPGKTDKPFTLDDMRLLLKTADIPEFFRDRLIAISYNPYTRVDVRRLYGQDILTEDQVYQNYLDLGYDETHAKALTDFTTKGAKAEEKGLTREAITNLYHDAILGRPEAKTMLSDLGYNDTNAEFWLLLVDYALDAADDNAKIAAIHDQFIAGDLDDSSVMAALGPLNLPSDRQARLLTQWVIQRTAKVKKPSVSQLETFYKKELIQIAAYRAGLLRYGFNAADAELFVKLTDLETQADAAKEQERAQTAADKAAASPKASSLTKALAILDAKIAEYRLEIANINVAFHQKPDDATAKILADKRDADTIAIAQANLDKALLRVE
jgi:hypothetical protein